MATPAAHPPRAPDGDGRARARGRVEDRELARLAVAGDGDAFAELYDRHERRVYGFCMRMLGTPHDAADATQETFVRMLGRLPAMQGRELNFVAYALACARNACYDMIEGRRRVEPIAAQPDGASLGAGAAAPGDVALDPERAALLAAAREGVRAANAELPARQREVLALREVELLSYDEIGEIMGLNRNAVAQLVSRARIKLRDLLRGSELASIAAASPACARAQPLLASMQDDQPGEDGELEWARAHLGACETCRLSRAAMEEAGVSYRALAPLVPAVWLRHAAIARAAEFVGADWSHLIGSGMRAGGEPAADTEPAAHAGESSTTMVAAASDLATRPAAEWRRRPRRLAWLLAAAALLALGIVVVAMAGGTRDGPGRSLSSQLAPASVQAIGPAATGGATRKHRSPPAVGPPGSPGSSTRGAFVHASTGAASTVAPRNSTRRAREHHPRRSVSGRRSPPASSVPAVTTPAPPAPSPTVAAPTTTSAPASTPTTTTPPAQTTPEPAPPTTTPGGSTGTTTTPTAPPEDPRDNGGGLIP
jgi:RNA polymerase sigma-70 factor (ECF subfamily)